MVLPSEVAAWSPAISAEWLARVEWAEQSSDRMDGFPSLSVVGRMLRGGRLWARVYAVQCSTEHVFSLLTPVLCYVMLMQRFQLLLQFLESSNP